MTMRVGMMERKLEVTCVGSDFGDLVACVEELRAAGVPSFATAHADFGDFTLTVGASWEPEVCWAPGCTALAMQEVCQDEGPNTYACAEHAEATPEAPR